MLDVEQFLFMIASISLLRGIFGAFLNGRFDYFMLETTLCFSM